MFGAPLKSSLKPFTKYFLFINKIGITNKSSVSARLIIPSWPAKNFGIRSPSISPILKYISGTRNITEVINLFFMCSVSFVTSPCASPPVFSRFAAFPFGLLFIPVAPYPADSTAFITSSGVTSSDNFTVILFCRRFTFTSSAPESFSTAFVT